MSVPPTIQFNMIHRVMDMVSLKLDKRTYAEADCMSAIIDMAVIADVCG
jgi:hypothetical protein